MKSYVVLISDGVNCGVVMNGDGSPIFTEEEAKKECAPDIMNEGLVYRMVCIEDQFYKIM